MAFEKKYNKGGWKNNRSSSYPSSRIEDNHSSRIIHHASKRGSLSTLMTEEAKSSANIQDLSYDFSCRIVRLFQYLNEDAEYKEYIMSKQIYRSGTSIGANVREAQHGQSDMDFLSKMSISLKEADETNYWLCHFTTMVI